MTVTDFDLTRSNATVYPDEVALVNAFRRIKRSLPTGYGDIRFSIQVSDHCGESVEAVVEEKAIVDKDAPVITGTIRQFPGNAT